MPALGYDACLDARGICNSLKIAVRPPRARTGRDGLHALVEARGMIVPGDLLEPLAVALVIAWTA